MSLKEYRKKRDFKKTPEPVSKKSRGKSHKNLIFVVQEHHASHLHYDFRLEAFGVLKSWAVPKGPSTHVGDKRLAVEVEDHPIDYASFQGVIPEGEYGAGHVKIWDHGTWAPLGKLKKDLEEGHLEFELKGKKLQGKWLLQRTGKSSGAKSQWLLIKRNDKKESAVPDKVKVPSASRKSEPLPHEIKPQLAQLVDRIPEGDRYIHEIKFDGYRTLIFKESSKVTMRTRSGLDWTNKYKPLDLEFKKLNVKSAVIDGELVALDEKGHSHFSNLQEAISDENMTDVVFYAFDLLYVNGHDLREEPLEKRKQILKEIIKNQNSDQILFSEHVRGAQGKDLYEKAVSEGLEGIISKDRLQPYKSGRSALWQKIKTSKRQEFVIGGYTDPQGERQSLGALLMGVYEGKKLKYVGKVGTGFNDNTLNQLLKKLKPLTTKESPFSNPVPKGLSKIHWVKPATVAEVEFKAWTGDGNLRHASFVGLREDKAASSIRLEKSESIETEPANSSKNKKTNSSAFRLTHPDRIVYPESETKKIDVANYYKSVSPWLLEHISHRPLSMIRCPDQAGPGCFFQKHAENSHLTEIDQDTIEDQEVVYLKNQEGLLQLVQWGVLEFHPWQTHIETSESPDQIIFDLDPDDDVSWKQVLLTAFRLKELLDKLDLKSFVKTTGGKGLHVHVPIAPNYDWDQVKNFSKTICLKLSEDFPKDYTTSMAKKSRKGRIFLDYLRNGFGATAVAPFSLRAKEQPTVAMPLAWEELPKLKDPQAYDISNALQRLAQLKFDPWKGYGKLKQKIGILEKREQSESKRS